MKLSRKRKKKYKKDLVSSHRKYFINEMIKSISNNDFDSALLCELILNINFKKLSKILFSLNNNVKSWEWFYFKRRVEVQCMYTILGCQDTGYIDKQTGKWIRYDKPKENYVNDEILLNWYKKHYPNDKLAHHYCKQNRIKYRKL